MAESNSRTAGGPPAKGDGWGGHLATSAGALIVVGAALLYLFGMMRSAAYLGHFGLVGQVPSDAYQLIGTGAADSVWLLLAIVLGTAVLELVGFFSELVIGKVSKSRKVKVRLKAFTPASVVLSAGLIAAPVAVGMGVWVGQRGAERTRSELTSSCPNCFTYETTSGTLMGVPVAGDETKLALLVDRDQVRLVRWDTVQGIRRWKKVEGLKAPASDLREPVATP